MGASLGARRGSPACTRQPDEQIVPYVRAARDGSSPASRCYFATRDDARRSPRRPARREPRGPADEDRGQPRAPGEPRRDRRSRQASVLELYDPDRSQVVTRARARSATWSAFLAAMRVAVLERRARPRGAGLRMLTRDRDLADARAQLARGFEACSRSARWHQYEPLRRDDARAGARLAFGRDVEHAASLRPTRTSILALDADFLGAGPARVRHAREFARAAAARGRRTMSRLYARRERRRRSPGAMADHRLPLPSRVQAIARRVRARGRAGAAPARDRARRSSASTGRGSPRSRATSPRIAARGLVIAGRASAARRSTPSRTRSTRRSATSARPCAYAEPVEAEPRSTSTESLARAARDMAAGRVELLADRSAATRSTTRRPISTSPRRSTASGCACTSRLYDDETSRALPLARARGALPREPGATRARSTARCRSCSR